MPKPPRRRPPTIDLEATKIVSANPADAERGPAGPAAGAKPDPAPDTAEPTGEAREQHGDSCVGPDSTMPPGRQHAEHPGVEGSAESRQSKRGVSVAVVMGSAIAGVCVAALAGAILWGVGLIAPSEQVTRQALSPVVASIAALDRRLAELPRRSELEQVDTRLAKLEAAPNPSTENAVTAIEARLAKLEAKAAAPSPQLGAIESRLARIEAAATTAPAADHGLANRLAALDRRVEEAVTTARAAAGEADAAEKTAATGSAESAVAKVRNGLDDVAARLRALEASVRGIEQRVTKIAGLAEETAAVRLALAAMELRMAIDRGQPFGTELAVAKQLGQDHDLIAAIEPFAQSGVPSPAALAQELSRLGPAMLKAAVPADEDRGVFARLAASASRLVRIRPVEESPGDDPDTIVARAEVKATRGDIAGAAAELDRLPASVRAAAAGWISAAQARLAALDAARRLSASALAALGNPAR